MQSCLLGRVIQLGSTVYAVALLLSGCSTPAKLTPEQLASLGVREGAMYWEAEQKLLQQGYRGYVSGARREDFDFTKETGTFPSCVLRVQFKVDEQNLVSDLRVAEPACIGTP